MGTDKKLGSKFCKINFNWLSLLKNPTLSEASSMEKLSHEIKNPLTLIKSTLQLIEIQTPEVKSNKHWSSLYEEIDYITLLLDSFKKNQSEACSEESLVDIDNLIQSIADLFNSLAHTRNIEFYIVKQDTMSPVLGNETKLSQALINLLKNAFEATEDGGTISINVKQIEDSIFINITDTGHGIEAQKLPKIFEPYITYKNSGTGLGLPIAKSIILQHNGTIDVTSSIGRGTSFVISLPIAANQEL